MGLTLSKYYLLPLFSTSRPFDRVPDELLMLIFEALGAIPSAPPPVSLLKVCRRWRSVALATPGLWASITLHGGDQLATPALRRMLELSKDVPLYLDLDVAGQATYPGTECPPQLLREVLNHIDRSMPRIASLQLRFYPSQSLAMQRIWRADAPVLEELVLMCGGVFQPDMLSAPELRRLEIDRMQVARFRFDGFPLLAEVELKAVEIFLADLYNMLASAPRLETLRLRDVGFVGLQLVADTAEEWPHASLRELIVRHPHAESPVLAAFLLKLDLASLTRVEVALDPYSRELWGEAEALCTVLCPRALRVTRSAKKKIWRAELRSAQWAFSFPQRVAGPVLSELIDGVAAHVERVEADLAFCEQIVRRAATDALPPFPRLETFVAVSDDKGRLPQNAAWAEAELRRERFAMANDDLANTNDWSEYTS